MTDPADLRRQLAGTVPADDPAWRRALQDVPRELFLGDALFRLTGTQWEPVHRDQTEHAVTRAIARLEGKRTPDRDTIVPPHLIVRATTAAAPLPS
ncbi:hypothetical protein [Streptomyces sp. NPDC003710]